MVLIVIIHCRSAVAQKLKKTVGAAAVGSGGGGVAGVSGGVGPGVGGGAGGGGGSAGYQGGTEFDAFCESLSGS